MRVALALIGLLSAWLATSAAGAQTPLPDLVISEVLPNAGQGNRDAAFEWVEIENRSGNAISLDGWALEDNNARDALPAISVPTGGFVLLVGSQDGAEALTAALTAAGVEIGLIGDGRIGNGLANTGDHLLLIDPTGATVDGVSWGTDRSVTESMAPPAGLSLSRGRSLGAPVIGAATPGVPAPTATTAETAAAEAPADIRITEIFANAGAGQRDAAFEWIELHNPTGKAESLDGWFIADNGGSDRLPAAEIAAGGYLVVAGSVEAAGVEALVVEDGRLGSGLANGGDLIALIDPAGREVARVDFSSPPLPRPEAGASLALVDGLWILNLEPTPGAAGSTGLLSRLNSDGSLSDSDEGGERGAPAREKGEGGISALAILAIGLAPLLAWAAVTVWRRRAALKPQR